VATVELRGQRERLPNAGPAQTTTRRVAVVVPCFNRRQDAEALLGDLGKVKREWRASRKQTDGSGGAIDLRVLLVDNASEVSLTSLIASHVHLEHLRLNSNTGGSGGYNAGMRRVLALDDENAEAMPWREWDAEYVWLVDSDARVGPETLRALLEVMERDPSVAAAGSTICDPLTGQGFELGGHVNRKNGNFEPMVIGSVGVREPVDADYVAACCALVRADAIRDTGVFPDRFLNGDDVEWFIRMKSITGQRVVGVPDSLAMHPRFDRFPTWPRYYMSRNAFGPIDAVGGGRSLRWRRALREVPRAMQQQMMGRADLARLHLSGLRHAAGHSTLGPAPDGLIVVDHPQPFEALSRALIDELGMGRARPTTGRVLARLLVSDEQRTLIAEQLVRAGVVVRRGQDGVRPEGLLKSTIGAARRLALGPAVDVAVIPSRGRPDSWFLGRLTVAVTPQGFILRRPSRFASAARGAFTLGAGLWQARRVGLRGDDPASPAKPFLHDNQQRDAEAAKRTGLSVTAVVLSHNRWEALEASLRGLRDSGLFQLDDASSEAPWQVLVADNASSDGSAEAVARAFPRARMMKFETNLGVEAFNRAVAACTSDLVLILDDDALPDSRALRRAAELMARRGDLGAVALHPRHPHGRGATAGAAGRSEWAFAAKFEGSSTDQWPVMGCGNLIRREAWERAGGYEAGYFLYRNDTDLALKLLGLGYGVHFNPAWVVWHDTVRGAGARKSESWHRLATRNWVWMARRHGRGPERWIGAAMGWLWAHKLAGLSAGRQIATVKGGFAGVFGKSPKLADPIRSRSAWHELLRLLASRS